MKNSILFFFALCATSSQGFLMPQRSHSMPAMAAAASEDIDYDAPTDRAMGVGNIVREPDDHFEVGNIVDEMDEECYMGKDGDFDECVDFDPVP